MLLVNHFLEQSAQRLPDKTAVICGERHWTYAELDLRADRLAATLGKMGVRRHDRVAIFLENSAEAVISLFAVLKAGAAFVLLNPGMKEGKLSFILNDSGARAIIAPAARQAVVIGAAMHAPELTSLVWCGGTPAAGSASLAGKAQIPWEAATDPANPPARLPACIDIDLATIIYTSGSTGEPKGVVSTHRNVVAAARSITTYLQNVESDIVLAALPLSFDYGLYQVLMSALFGGTVVLEKSFTYPYRILERLVTERVTGFPIVPTMVALLLQMQDLERFDLSALRYITNTAAALPVPHIRRLQALFPQVRIFSMYGLTECKRTLWLPPEELAKRPGSVGIAIPNEEVFVVNEAGEEVGPEEIGELVVRGANVMQGYWNRPEETARTYRPGRWRDETILYTGDLFRRDADGFLYFVARKDDLIKTRGERVSPKEIENVLCDLDGVVEAAVLGVPDEILGQAIKAYIVASPARQLSEEQIRRQCQLRLETFMMPKYVEFRESLPKSASGKIDRRSLRDADPLCQPAAAPPAAAAAMPVA